MFLCLFLFTIGKHISFFPSSRTSILLYLFCAQVPFLFRLLSIFCFSQYIEVVQHYYCPYLPISVCSIQFYTRNNSSFVIYFLSFLSFFKDNFALDFRLENYGRKDFLVAGVSCYHLAKAHETNLTSWALVQKSSGQVRFSPPTLLATMHFGSQPWSLPFFRLVLSMHQ